MRNLAGVEDADTYIRDELRRARIRVVKGKAEHSEVPYTLVGKLGGFAFHRAWYYWVADGLMPLDTAKSLYKDPVGRTDIRVAGHAGAPPPRQWAVWMTPGGERVWPANQEADYRDMVERHVQVGNEKGVFSDDPASLGAEQYVDTYHIDTEVGLRVFADAVHWLIAARGATSLPAPAEV